MSLEGGVVDQQNERSYYEIALTNTQVLVAFSILLVCVVGAFVAGLWVARRSFEETHLEASVERPADDGGEDGDDTFEFFEPESTTAEPSESEATQPSAGARATASQEPQPARLPQLPPETTSEPERAEPAQMAPQPTTEPAATPALVIQVFSSRDEAQARKLIERLRDADFPAFLAPDTLGGQPVYRVRVGPYADRGRAEAQADRLKREHRLDTWITSSPGGP